MFCCVSLQKEVWTAKRYEKNFWDNVDYYVS